MLWAVARKDIITARILCGNKASLLMVARKEVGRQRERNLSIQTWFYPLYPTDCNNTIKAWPALAQQVKLLAANPDNLSYIPGIHMIRRREPTSIKLSSDFHMNAVGHVHMCVHVCSHALIKWTIIPVLKRVMSVLSKTARAGARFLESGRTAAHLLIRGHLVPVYLCFNCSYIAFWITNQSLIICLQFPWWPLTINTIQRVSPLPLLH